MEGACPNFRIGSEQKRRHITFHIDTLDLHVRETKPGALFFSLGRQVGGLRRGSGP